MINLTIRRKSEASVSDMTLYSLYEPISRIKQSVILNLDKFKATMIELQKRTLIYRSDQDYTLALKLRQTILDQFTEMDHQAKRIKALNSNGRIHQVIQNGILRSVLLFLQSQMFALQIMPFVRPKADESEIIKVLNDSISQMNLQLNDAIKKGNQEEITALTMQIRDLERELVQKI